jgi:ribosomal-protein-alanine N-acetyltransferase
VPSTVPFPPGYGVRPVRLDDAERVAAAYVRNRDHLAPWEPTRPPEFFTPEGQRELIRGQRERTERGEQAVWVVTHGEQVVGRAALSNVSRGPFCSATLGYWVDAGHLRRGLARAAVEHACAEAGGLSLHRVEAGTLLHNDASQRVLLAAGFEHVGTARGFLFIAGRWQDHRLYQRLLNDDPPPGEPV